MNHVATKNEENIISVPDGYDDEDIHRALLNLNFKPFLYNSTKRHLTEIGKFGTHNTIYIRDIDFVYNRLKSTSKIKILDKEI
jgi:hypothetical protein